MEYKERFNTRLKIPYTKFIMALKLFELEIPALKASKELALSYNCYKIYKIIREKMYDHTINMRIDKSIRFANGKVYINGIELSIC